MTKRTKTIRKIKEQPDQHKYTQENWNQDILEEKKWIEENHLAQPPLWLLNNIYFCYDEESPINKDNKKNEHLLQIKEKHKNTKEALHRLVK